MQKQFSPRDRITNGFFITGMAGVLHQEISFLILILLRRGFRRHVG